MKIFFSCAILATSLGACSPAQIDASARLAEVIGTDIVNIECSPSAQNLVQVIAVDVKASQRVQNALAANAKLATDACPLLKDPLVKVITGAVDVAQVK
jgi:hypothetical protein